MSDIFISVMQISRLTSPKIDLFACLSDSDGSNVNKFNHVKHNLGTFYNLIFPTLKENISFSVRSHTKIYTPISHLLVIIWVPFSQPFFFPTFQVNQSWLQQHLLWPSSPPAAHLTLTLTGAVSGSDNAAWYVWNVLYGGEWMNARGL